MNGHWFCLHCDDTVFLPTPRPGHDDKPVKCPDCHHKTASFVPGPGPKRVGRPVIPRASIDYARQMFNHMRETVQQAPQTRNSKLV